MTLEQKQCLLRYLDCYKGSIDGIWGEKSKAATAKFQSLYMGPEDVDSDFGPKTEARILEVIATGEEPKENILPEAANYWKDIRYWTREEFRCRCGEYHAPYCNGFPVEPDRALVELADNVRAHFGRPAHRTSGIRCQRHNADSGGVANSKHLSGKALDFWVDGVSGARVLAYVLTLPGVNFAYQIKDTKSGKLTDCVHMDVK